MDTMTTHERMARMYAHQEADRIPVTDSPWGATIERWQREGMPEDVSYVDYFGLDKIAHFGVDNSPRYPARVVEETDEYVDQHHGVGRDAQELEAHRLHAGVHGLHHQRAGRLARGEGADDAHRRTGFRGST